VTVLPRPAFALACLLLVGGGVTPTGAQEAVPIQDNSFLIEEAYNQESGVVQHISMFERPDDGRSWTYTFTQEWPLRGQRHQLSATLPLHHAAGPDGATALGDVLLNYRYQALGMAAGARLHVSPRLSLMMPTGDEVRGFGEGGVGVQVNLPVSAVLAPRWVTHYNAGFTLVPRARGATGARATAVHLNAGASVVWLLRPAVNLLVESVWLRTAEVTGPGTTRGVETFLVSPGVRAAFTVNGVQIVPGLAYAIDVGPEDSGQSLLMYLSFEHRFR
jgi:hypothetical protein